MRYIGVTGVQTCALPICLRGVPGRGRLDARRQRLELAPRGAVGLLAGEDLVELADEPPLREVQRVRGGQRDQQPPLVRAVVHEDDLVLAGRTELAARSEEHTSELQSRQ